MASFATSTEMRASLAPTFQAGVFVPSATDSAVARLYYGLLGRSPDAGGLQNWASSLAQGMTLAQVAEGFLGSVEYGAAHGTLTNAEFVNAIYQGALGHGTAGWPGSQNWTDALNSGTSRASVGVAISESVEATIHLLPAIENGFHLAG